MYSCTNISFLKKNESNFLSQILLNCAKTDINLASDGGVTPLMMAVKSMNQLMVKQLLNRNVEVTTTDNEGMYMCVCTCTCTYYVCMGCVCVCVCVCVYQCVCVCHCVCVYM